MCQNCGLIFRARRDAKTCSAACRKRLQRTRAFLAVEAEKLRLAALAAYDPEQRLIPILSPLLPDPLVQPDKHFLLPANAMNSQTLAPKLELGMGMAND